MQHLLTPGRNVLKESKNSLLRIKSLQFYVQNLANKGTQGTKRLGGSSESLWLLSPPLSSFASPRWIVAPKNGGRKEWEGDLGVSRHNGVWDRDIHALLRKVLRNFCLEEQKNTRYLWEINVEEKLCLIS